MPAYSISLKRLHGNFSIKKRPELCSGLLLFTTTEEQLESKWQNTKPLSVQLVFFFFLLFLFLLRRIHLFHQLLGYESEIIIRRHVLLPPLTFTCSVANFISFHTTCVKKATLLGRNHFCTLMYCCFMYFRSMTAVRNL